jgi:hypothetical protein
VANAKTRHAGVDLEVDTDGSVTVEANFTSEGLHLPGVVDDGGEVVGEQFTPTVPVIATHHENGSVNSSVSKLDSFLEEGDADPVDACPFEGSGDGWGAVSVCVGLEDSPDAGIACEATNDAEVVAQVAEVDFCPGGTDRIGGGCATGALNAGQGGEGRYRHVGP